VASIFVDDVWLHMVDEVKEVCARHFEIFYKPVDWRRTTFDVLVFN
jgi:hypothetical protein